MKNSIENALQKDEFEKLWEGAVKGDELDRLIFVCAGYLGMRSSEIAHMRKDWVDFENKKVVIPGRDEEFETSVGKSARVIPFGDLRDRVETELRRYFDYNDSIGRSRETVFRRVKKMGKRASIDKKVSPDSLRATCAVQLAEAGINARGLRQFMGWKNLNTAEKYIQQAGISAGEQIKNNKEKLW